MNPALELLPKKARDAASQQWREDMGSGFNITERLCRVVDAANRAMPTQPVPGNSGGVEEGHRWTLISDEDPNQTEACGQCGAQRDKNGPLPERAWITGGWPSDVDCESGRPEPTDEVVEALAKRAWNSVHLHDDEADWETAKRMGLPGVEKTCKQVASTASTQPPSPPEGALQNMARGEEPDEPIIEIDEKQLAERRKDPGFRARLERSIEENRELLERLGQPPSPQAEVQDRPSSCPQCGAPDGYPPAGPCSDPYHGTGKQSPAEPQGEKCTPSKEMHGESIPNCISTEPQGDVVEYLAKVRRERVRGGTLPWDELSEVAKAPIRDHAAADLAAITPLLPGPSYAQRKVLQRMLGEAERRRDETEGEPWKAVAVERASVLGEVIRTLDALPSSSRPSYALEVRERLEEEAHKAEGAVAKAKNEGDFDVADFYEGKAQGVRVALAALDKEDSDV